jgi:hypothetical protein
MPIKKWLILFLSILSLQGTAQAEEILTTVFNVVESKRTNRILVLSGVDGKVYKYPRSDRNLGYMKSLVGSVVKLTYFVRNKESIIRNVSRVNPRQVRADELDLNHFQYNQLRQFTPSDLQSEHVVKQVFSSMLNDGDRRRSQCFKRAHMWAYDMWSNLGLYSQKLFIFYTQRYIQLEDTDWWFHVAPMVIAGGVEYVLDGTFMKGPITVKEWQAHFIKSENITCPIVDKYQDYENGQWKRLCYLMKVPMYYFSPLNIEHRDKNGTERNHWVLEELQDARRAFKSYRQTYEVLDTGKPTVTH